MIFLLTGKAGSGKDTIGEHLKEKYNFKSESFAAPIKRLVKDIFVLPDEMVYGRDAREKDLGPPWEGLTVRNLLQKIGTEMFRNMLNKDVLSLSLWLRISNDLNSDWVITDLRFPNERSVIEGMSPVKVVTIKVVRPGANGQTAGGINGHESESHDVSADHVIINDKDVRSLLLLTDEIMHGYGIISERETV